MALGLIVQDITFQSVFLRTINSKRFCGQESWQTKLNGSNMVNQVPLLQDLSEPLKYNMN